MSHVSHRPGRAARHRRGRADSVDTKIEIDSDSDYGVQLGWCESEADLEDVKGQTHDTLIANMGSRRIGGVRWTITTGDEAFGQLSVLFAQSAGSGEHSDEYRRIRGMLREYGGFLVTALAEGIKP